ncbi:MAG: hypothetical protein GF370_05060, partial [Candidatus Nealsonbacteria bacterium]|nr:hypothetical protein [Candidatus Nealsonbacteria bacterium]
MGVIIKENAEVCPECGSSHSVLDIPRGEITCQNCGLVIRSKAIDHSVRRPEQYHRGGAESMIDSNKGLGSLIPKKKEDFYKKKLTPRKSGEIYRMRKWDSRLASARAGPGRGLPVLKRFCSNLRVPDEIMKEAAIMMRKFLRKDLMRGRSFECTSAAIIYLSYKMRGYHLSLNEIAE